MCQVHLWRLLERERERERKGLVQGQEYVIALTILDLALPEMFIFQRPTDALEGGLLDRRLGEFSISNPGTAKAI